ncbi:MAG: hypothetical protein WCZ65_08060 [Lysobacteraceae bacterium]
MKNLWRFSLLSALSLAAATTLAATPDRYSPPDAEAEAVEQIWTVDGGEMRLRFNDSLLDLFGVRAEFSTAVRDTTLSEHYAVFPVLLSEGLRFNAPEASFDRFTDGGLRLRGGFTLHLPDGARIDLRDALLRPNADNPVRLDVIGADGQTWVYIDHLMYKFVDDHQGFHVRTADLRASAALGKRLDAKEIVDAYIGELRMDLAVRGKSREFTVDPKSVLGGPNFHGDAHPAGGTYIADVLMESYSMSFSRCRRSNGTTNGCDGAGPDDGEVVFTPSATLRNSDTDRTADVPWYQKFTTSPHSYPYPGNDQHPYLIWNLYRIVDDQLEQIAASGVKHAFLTINSGCAPGAYTGNGHILGRRCGDTYGTGNNDAVGDLGPRHEILPGGGIWGRCRSIFDTNCDGNANSVPSCSGASPGCYANRLVVRESQMLVPGATFWSESWYIVQDDVDIYNTMGRRSMSPAPGGTGWTTGSQSAMARGPVINAWVDPVAHPARNIELVDRYDVAVDGSSPPVSVTGHVRVAVKVKPLAACPAGLSGVCHRYDYAVNNFDYARSQLSGQRPNLEVTHARGFDRFRIALPAGAQAVAEAGVHFADIDLDPSNDWAVSISADHIEWSADRTSTMLDWGKLYRFSFVSNSAPGTDATVTVELRPVDSTAPALIGNMVGPGSDPRVIYLNGFEG